MALWNRGICSWEWPHSPCQCSGSIRCTEDRPTDDIPLSCFFFGDARGSGWSCSLWSFETMEGSPASLCYQDGRVVVLLLGSVAVEQEDLGCCPRKTIFVAL